MSDYLSDRYTFIRQPLRQICILCICMYNEYSLASQLMNTIHAANVETTFLQRLIFEHNSISDIKKREKNAKPWQKEE